MLRQKQFFPCREEVHKRKNLPQQVCHWQSNFLQYCNNLIFTSSGVKDGYFDKIKQQTPATIGAATLVPLICVYGNPELLQEIKFVAGKVILQICILMQKFATPTKTV